MKEKLILTPKELTDDWLFTQGYFRYGNNFKRDGYDIVLSSERWKLMLDTCLSKTTEKIEVDGKPFFRHTYITPSMLCNTFNTGHHKRIVLNTVKQAYGRQNIGPGRPKGSKNVKKRNL